MRQKDLVLFDFDGTLTSSDSLLRFLLFAVPPLKLLTGAIVLVFQYLKMIWSGQWTNEKGKEALLSIYFKGLTLEALQQLGTAFCRDNLPRILRPELLAMLREYRDAGAVVVIVSASPDIWLAPFCSAERIQLICTSLHFEDEKYTGALATPNCNGPEKARRIRAAFDLALFQKIIAFGNSAGDLEMLALADEAYIVRKGKLELKTKPAF
jgi:phosphatidylglycerophosphatase C